MLMTANCICCLDPIVVDCFCAAAGFRVNLPAPNDGDVYHFVAEYYGALIRLQSLPTVAGQPIVFSGTTPESNTLNPMYVYWGSLQLAGAIQTLYIGSTPHQCIELRPKQFGAQGTTPAVTLTPTP